MLHPVGRLPARVYWRRRLVLLTVVLALLAGGGWLTLRLLDARPGAGGTASATTTSRSVPTPALEQVLPSLAGVRIPETAPGMPAPETRRTPKPAGPTSGGACTDTMIELAVRAPKRAPAGREITVELVVRNVSAVPCVRRVDAQLQEVVLVDDDGDRVWGSNDCLREESDRERTLEPEEGVALPIEWSGRTSEPTCTRERTAPPAGDYVLRGRLDDKKAPDRRIRLT